MFIRAFLEEDQSALKDGIEKYLDDLDLTHEFDWALGERDLPTGVPSRYLDIFPKGIVQKHESFGLVYVRLWLVGRNPTKLLFGIFLGAERAQQSEPRRAANFVRDKLEAIIEPLERSQGFQYKTWGDSDIWWNEDGMSVRAVTRQFEQFVTYKAVEPDASEDQGLESTIADLVRAVDTAITELEPLREFGKSILLLYYGENLPQSADEDTFAENAGQGEGGATSELLADDWFSSLTSAPDLGDLKGLDDAFRKVVSALAAGKHVLLMGAPGVGKTELAEAVCRQIQTPYNVVTATSDWTSIQTIGGYMPIPNDDSGQDPLDFVPGVFTDAMSKNEWLIVDEMNRADIDKAFGEMFTLLGGKRKSISLPYRKRQDDGSYRRIVLGTPTSGASDTHVYRLEPTWRLIGTMNTFDKASLYQLSYAFSRRVAVIDLAIPNPADFLEILQTAATPLADDFGDEFHDAVLRSLKTLFVENAQGSLRKLNLGVGPAIPLDMLKFIHRLRRFETDPASIMIVALEAYLFPQFEGMHEQSDDIASAISHALDIPSLPPETLSRLRTFTGAFE